MKLLLVDFRLLIMNMICLCARNALTELQLNILLLSIWNAFLYEFYLAIFESMDDETFIRGMLKWMEAMGPPNYNFHVEGSYPIGD